LPGSRRVRVVTDSTADLPPDLVVQWGIQVVPLGIHFGEESFRDGVDMSAEVFYARLARGEFPTTSQPPVGLLRRAYEQGAAGGGEVVSIHLSSRLSGTYQAALLAAEQVDGRVAVVDSEQLSMAVGWLVLAAAEAAREGCSLGEVVARVEEMKRRTRVLALIESLEHFRRGGRIGRTQAVLGTLLDIRAVLSLEDGETVLLERVRTRRAGLRRLVERIAAMGPLERLCVLHADAPEDAHRVARSLAPVWPGREIRVVPAGQAVAIHVGPQAVGVACVLAR